MARLIESFARLPGIGRKTASRLAYHVMRMDYDQAMEFASAIVDARNNLHYCACCQNISDEELCPICADESRDRGVICVVERPRDIPSIEKTREFRGLYHVLHGLISPIDGVGPEELRVKELLERVGAGGVREIIMATNPTVEGEATALYLARLLKPFDVTVTRLAFGLPVGGDLEYADEVTLSRALEGRREMQKNKKQKRGGVPGARTLGTGDAAPLFRAKPAARGRSGRKGCMGGMRMCMEFTVFCPRRVCRRCQRRD